MKELLNANIEKFKKLRKRRQRTVSILCVLSVAVILGVFWQLRIVGITMTDEAYCGKIEHTHSEECIGEKRLICGFGDGTLEEAATTNIALANECQEEHIHDSSCYTSQSNLVCKQERHIHTAECYTQERVLICNENHEHEDFCYEMQEILICKLEEHEHGESCYYAENVLACTKEEDIPDEISKVDIGNNDDSALEEKHVHTDECYEIIYSCGFEEEHIHTLLCYSNPSADVESRNDWENTLPGGLTGDWSKDLVVVAQSQIGYQESTENFELAEDENKKGYTRYGEWYGNPYGDWSAMFTSFCLHYADIPEDVAPRNSGVGTMKHEWNNLGLLEDREYLPKAGDLIFLDKNGDGDSDSIGILSQYDATSNYLKAVEGDSADRVCENEYKLSDNTIIGYGSLTIVQEHAVELGIIEKPEELEQTVKETFSEINASENDLIRDTNGVIIRAVVTVMGEDNVLKTSLMKNKMTQNIMPFAKGELGQISEHLSEAKIIVDGVEYDGSVPLDPQKEFAIKLKWDLVSSDLNSTLTYTYNFPKGIVVEDVAEQPLLDKDGNRQGVYSITDGVLTVVYDNVADKTLTDFELNAHWDTTQIDQITEIPWNDELKTEVQFEKSQISVTKKNTSVENAQDGSLIALYEIDIKSRGDVENITLTDTMTSTTGKIKFCPKYFTDDNGDTWDYRYQITTDESGSPVYQYGNFPDNAFNPDGTVKDSITFPQFNLKNGEICKLEYATKIDADDRAELDFKLEAEKLTNTAAGSYVENGETITSSVTIEDTYKADKAPVVKEKGSLTDEGVYVDTDIPWKVSVNPGMTYGMGGALVTDKVQTEGMVYKTDALFRITTKQPDGTTSVDNKTWITLSDKTIADIQSAGGNASELLFLPENKAVLDEIETATGVNITRDNISDYVFVNTSKTSYVWFVPKQTDTDGNEIPCAYELEYITDASNVQSSDLQNSAGAAWEEWVYGVVTDTPMKEVGIEKKNDGVYIDKNGRYLVDWTIDITVPANRDEIPNVFLYDRLPSYTTTKGEGVDWLVGLSSNDFDYLKYADLDYLNELTRPAFSITTDSTDEAVKSIVENTKTSLGHPLKGVGDEFVIYDGTASSLGQLDIINGDAGYEGKTMSPTWFGVNLGTLPSTRGKEGYTITVKYTTQTNPQVVRESGKTPSELNNYVNLRQQVNGKDRVLGEANARYWITKTEVEDSLAKQVASYDPDTGLITYQVTIDPKLNLPAETIDYMVKDILSLEGANYIEDSFALAFLGTVAADGTFTYDPTTQTILWKSDNSLTGADTGLTDEQIAYVKDRVQLQVDNKISGSSTFQFVFNNWGNDFVIEKDGQKFIAPMVLTYQVKLPENGTGDIHQTNIRNTASLYEVKNGVPGLIDGVNNSFDFDSPIHKVMSGSPNSTNGYNAEFTIDVDTTDSSWPENLKDGKFTVTDIMSKSLQLKIETLKVYGIAANGTKTELPASAYTAAYDERDENNNYLAVTIEQQEGYEKYKIVYETHINGAAETTVSYDNVAQVDGTDIVSETIEDSVYIQKQSGSVEVINYEFTLHKYDAGNINIPLVATFNLYAYNKTDNTWDKYENALTTGADGKLVINNKDYPGALKEDTWYKLVETSSPQGYLKGVSYFYLGELVDGTFRPEEITNEQILPLQGGTLNIPNYKASLRLRKVDAKDNNITLSGAEFALYDSPDCIGNPIKTSTGQYGGIYSFDLTGLEAGETYYLKETKAPDGYLLGDTIYTVTFDNEGNVTVKNGDGTIVESISNAYPIPNQSGYELPMTGGFGNLLYLLCGMLLIAAPLVYGFRLRRRHGRRGEV